MKVSDTLEGVSAENMDSLVINSAEVLTSSRESNAGDLLHLIRAELLQIWVEHMIQADLVSESYSHVVATRMQGT